MSKPNNYIIELTPSEIAVVREALTMYVKATADITEPENDAWFDIDTAMLIRAKLHEAIVAEINEQRGSE